MPKVELDIEQETLDQAEDLVASGTCRSLDEAVKALLRGDGPGPIGDSEDEEAIAQGVAAALRAAYQRQGKARRDEAAVERMRAQLCGCQSSKTLEEVMDELRGRGVLW